jgi:hypothetical protein
MSGMLAQKISRIQWLSGILTRNLCNGGHNFRSIGRIGGDALLSRVIFPTFGFSLYMIENRNQNYAVVLKGGYCFVSVRVNNQSQFDGARLPRRYDRDS